MSLSLIIIHNSLAFEIFCTLFGSSWRILIIACFVNFCYFVAFLILLVIIPFTVLWNVRNFAFLQNFYTASRISIQSLILHFIAGRKHSPARILRYPGRFTLFAFSSNSVIISSLSYVLALHEIPYFHSEPAIDEAYHLVWVKTTSYERSISFLHTFPVIHVIDIF